MPSNAPRAAAVVATIAWLLGGHPHPTSADDTGRVSSGSGPGASAVAAPAPRAWKPSRRRCGEHEGRRFCDGPRRVPRPVGPAAERASRLGLGTAAAAAKLLRSEPRKRWRRALDELGIERPDRLVWPVDGGSFGRGLSPAHDGVDIGAERGARIRAVADGLVAYADNGIRGYGNLLIVLHGGARVSVYAHCRAVYVFPGQRVQAGQHVADVGETGLTRGEHLHFEWRSWGRIADPLPRFGRWWE